VGQLPEPGSEKEPSCFLFVQVGAIEVAVALLMLMMMMPELSSSDAVWFFALLLLRRDAPRLTQTKH